MSQLSSIVNIEPAVCGLGIRITKRPTRGIRKLSQGLGRRQKITHVNHIVQSSVNRCTIWCEETSGPVDLVCALCRVLVLPSPEEAIDSGMV